MKPYGTQESKKAEVKRMFDRIAPAYDRLNHILSFNFDRSWRRKTARMAARNNPSRIADVASGTGDLAISLARRLPLAHVTGIDLSPEMAAVAEKKISAKGLSARISMTVGDGEETGLPGGGFDCVTIGFGIRNFQNIAAGLTEAARLLDEGGNIQILEFSEPKGKIFGPLYRFYFRNVLPRIGGLVSKDRDAYAYLPGSVGEFPAPGEFTRMMEEAGFAGCKARRLMRGVAYIYSGRKESGIMARPR